MLSQHAWHSSLWSKRLPSPAELQREMASLRDDVLAFARERPEVDGVEKLVKSIKGKLTGSEGRSFADVEQIGDIAWDSVSSVDAQQGMETLHDFVAPDEELSAVGAIAECDSAAMKQVQGAVNNLRGIRAELVAAEVLPEVVAVSKRFYSRPEEGRVYVGGE
eukprot:CAMPEP_0177773594 /NCGR_PEP_ID=MMETSP0491_2-20121128/12966_1 /TAXON_ID=63592 /ORGANISM="Tetraselmis chuii, Strain PLY429" /LENGTH=162 /DNA_ID=CAMNT_0019291735 /DNA_START=285 /DNA_END=770 /DNA_ORIENTATION=-